MVDSSAYTHALMSQPSSPIAQPLPSECGDAPLHILGAARERFCDLIVIGKHGRQAAEELLLGSVTKHVLAECQSDILITV